MENGTRKEGMNEHWATIQNNSFARATREKRLTHADYLQTAVANIMVEEEDAKLALKIEALQSLLKIWQQELFARKLKTLPANSPSTQSPSSPFSQAALREAFGEGLL